MDGIYYKDEKLGRNSVFKPFQDSIIRSSMTEFIRFCSTQNKTQYPSYEEFHQFSINDFRTFWRLFLEWSEMLRDGNLEPVCAQDLCEHATFFPNVRLNYAENLLRDDCFDDTQTALIAYHASGDREELSRGQLRDRVARLAGALTNLGISPGDHVVAVVHNNLGAIVAALAAAALGATVSTAAPEMGVSSILARFRQLAPVLLLADTRVAAGAAPLPLHERVADMARELPSLKGLVVLDDGPLPSTPSVPVRRLTELLANAPEPAAFTWPRFPFNHPLFILFSSGTTGKPKCIMHGAGGTLLEHLKEHRLHGDLRPTDTLFFHTSASWMMWNWQLSALACGAKIIVYDGPVTGPETLWRIVADHKVTVFGTSPPYLQLCQDFGYRPATEHDLSALRAVLSTGSILYDHQYDWVLKNVGPLPLQSISGGTDIIGCFVLGNPNLPVYRGEAQCRSLGLDVQAVKGMGDVSPALIGELVCRNPFPSRPLGFHGDVDGERFHRAYFSQNPGLWTHGDLIEFTAEGSARLHGRSDGVLNINGFRIGPAEIYRILQGIPGIREALAIEQRVPGGASQTRFVLLVVLREPGTLDRDLALAIRRKLAQDGSAAHVPALIAEVPELPVTHSGKRSERAASDALNGAVVGNAEALRNPDCLEVIRRQVALAEAKLANVDEGAGTAEQQLRAMWEELLGISPVEADDNFFDLGGNSLLAVRLFMEIRNRFGVDMPPATLFRAPTFKALVQAVACGAEEPFSPLVPLRAGRGRPLFLVHGLRGDVLEFRALVSRLGGDRPVYGIQARGLDPRQSPQDRVEDMAAYYVEHLRRLQPDGPYTLAGYSFGGLVAYEMARMLREADQEIDFLGLLDTYVHEGCLSPVGRQWFHVVRPLNGAWRKARLALGLERPDRPFPHNTMPLMEQQGRLSEEAFAAYRPKCYAGRVTFFRATTRYTWLCNPLPVWHRAVCGDVTVIDVPCGHLDMIQAPYFALLAELLTDSVSLRPARSAAALDGPGFWRITPQPGATAV